MFQFKPFSIVALFTILSSCGINSSLYTTSDKLNEYIYTIEGSIELPKETKHYKLMHYVNVHQSYLDNPKSPAAQAKFEERTANSEAFIRDMDNVLNHGYPIYSTNGKLDQSKIKYWIGKQLRYSSRNLESLGVSLSLRKVISLTPIQSTSDSRIKFRYQIEALGAVVIPKSGGRVIQMGVDHNEKISRSKVPLDPIAFYYRSMGSKFQSFEKSSLQLIENNQLESLLREEQIRGLLKLTKKNETNNPCIEPDGDHIVPHALSYYLDSNLVGCAEIPGLDKIQVTHTKKLKVQPTYPEFLRLFEDKKVNFFYYYDFVGEEHIRNSSAFIQRLKNQGFKQKKIGSKGSQNNNEAGHRPTTLIKTINGIEFTVDIEVAGQGGTEHLGNSLSSHEIIIFDGHAGYGTNIDSSFLNSERYPEDTYQIIMLNGCSTYKYGMMQVMYAKSAKDMDLYNQNLDLITTYSSVKGSRHTEVLLKKIVHAAELYQENAPDKETQKMFQKSLNWLQIIREINIAAEVHEKDNGMFMVSGEQKNQYSPDGKHHQSKRNLSTDEIFQTILDPNHEELLRVSALKSILKNQFQPPNEKKLRNTVLNLQVFCQRMYEHDQAHNILSTSFYLPGCMPRKIYLNKPMNYLNMKISQEKPVLLYRSGVLKKFMLADPIISQGFNLRDQRPIELYPSGKLKHFYATGTFDKLPNKKIPFSEHHPISLYESGELKSLTLDNTSSAESSDTEEPRRILEIGGFSLNYSDKISFLKDGSVVGGRLAKEMNFSGYRVPAGGSFSLYADGSVHELMGDYDNFHVVGPKGHL